MSFDAFSQTWLPRIEQEMRALLENEPLSLRPMYGMMRYRHG